MAFLKTVETPNGVPCTYHRPVGGEYAFKDGVVVIRVGSWFNKDAYLTDKGFIWLWNESLPISMANDVERTISYKQDSPFYGASLEAD